MTSVEGVLVGVAGAGLMVAWVAAVLAQTRANDRRPAVAEHDPGPAARSASLGDAGEATAGGSCLGRPFWAGLLVALGAETALLVTAGAERGGVAVYDQAEFFFALSWMTALVLAWFARRGVPGLLPVVVLPVALLFLGGAVLAPAASIGSRPASATSVWLLLHVLTSIVAYAAFSVTFAAAVLTLAWRYLERPAAAGAAAVERIGYQAAVFGFPFMTMVLFTGALWAKHVWGRYWAWDPIEAWALVTWLVYAAYLHAQYSRRWQGARAAWLAVAGFGCVIATYLFFTHL